MPALRRWVPCVAEVARRWLALHHGQALATTAPSDLAHAAQLDPGLRVEWLVQGAFAQLEAENLPEALALARRASRMAAADGFLQSEYFANLVLARVRRVHGVAHYALRILGALAAVAPPPWHRWIALETQWAAGVGAASVAGTGENETLFGPLQKDVAVYDALVSADAPVPAAASDFIVGRVHATPRGIRDQPTDPHCLAAVLARPDMPSRRLLWSGVPGVADAEVLASTAPARRLHTALCVALLAGDNGLDLEQEFFPMVYGFARRSANHDSVLRSLLIRMEQASERLQLERSGTRLHARARSPWIIPDPRCESGLEDRTLTFLAAHRGRATAKEIATAMNIPLRTVQRTVGVLVADGTCHAEPDGRRTEYVVDDTTFSEPTLHRLRGRWTR